jgi:hypothetical protein
MTEGVNYIYEITCSNVCLPVHLPENPKGNNWYYILHLNDTSATFDIKNKTKNQHDNAFEKN